MTRQSLTQNWFPLGLALLIASPILFYNAVAHRYPIGLAGLYLLMVDRIVAAGYTLPVTLPWYGPGGIPFAYPPLALYQMAFVMHEMGVPTFIYLRFTPPLLFAVALTLIYILARRLHLSPEKAGIAVFFIALTPDVLIYQVVSDGSVRSLALVITIAALIVTLAALDDGRSRSLIGAAFLIGLTAMTHFSYTRFLVLSVAVFTFIGPNPSRRIVRASLIGMGALLTASTWLIVVLFRYGVGVYTDLGDTMFTQGVFGNTWTLPPTALPFVIPLTLTTLPGLIYTLAFIAFVTALLGRKWLLPVWLLAIRIALADGERYADMVGAMLAANGLVDIVTRLRLHDLRSLRQPIAAFALCFAVFVVASTYRDALDWVTTQHPSLTDASFQTAEWMRTHADPQATYLFMSPFEGRAEWTAYLYERTPAICPWGAEWTGTFPEQRWALRAGQECASQQSWVCFQRLLASHRVAPDYLVLDEPAQLQSLRQQIDLSAQWSVVYANSATIVWQRMAMDNASVRLTLPSPHTGAATSPSAR